MCEQCRTQKFCLRCLKSDFDAVKSKFGLLIFIFEWKISNLDTLVSLGLLGSELKSGCVMIWNFAIEKYKSGCVRNWTPDVSGFEILQLKNWNLEVPRFEIIPWWMKIRSRLWRGLWYCSENLLSVQSFFSPIEKLKSGCARILFLNWKMKTSQGWNCAKLNLS